MDCDLVSDYISSIESGKNPITLPEHLSFHLSFHGLCC